MSNLPHSDEPALTTAEVAELTGKSVSTVNRWAEEGRLPVHVKGPGKRGARFFLKSDVIKASRPERTAS